MDRDWIEAGLDCDQMPKSRRKAARQVIEKICAWLLNAGAVEGENSAGILMCSYPFMLQTKAGPLLIHPCHDWIACRFHDVHLAASVLPDDLKTHFNQYSGKWNFHVTVYNASRNKDGGVWDGMSALSVMALELRKICDNIPEVEDGILQG